jgi:hypothetical protein
MRLHVIKSKLFYLSSHLLKALLIVIFTVLCTSIGSSQTDTTKHVKKDSVKVYNPQEEIAYDGKRYRVYNNWLTFGAGAGYNTKWPKDQKNVGVDLSIHIKQYYFRAGAFMSGNDFTAANSYNFHLGMGVRKEHEKYNLSAFIGPSYSYFKRPLSDSTEFGLPSILNTVYNRLGGYACLEAIYKIKYDVGIGGQVYCDYNEVQMLYGVRLVAYFSGAFRGVKYSVKKSKK